MDGPLFKPIKDDFMLDNFKKLLKNNSLRDTVKIASDTLDMQRSIVYERALIIRDTT